MAYVRDSFLFRDLDDEEEKVFRKWAHDNESLWADLPNEKCNVYHPVIQDEIKRIREERKKPNALAIYRFDGDLRDDVTGTSMRVLAEGEGFPVDEIKRIEEKRKYKW